MNKMGENEAEIKVQDFISYVRFNEQPKYTEKDWLLAIETILDLYQKEKEKNKFINEIKTIETDDTIQVVLTKSQYSFLLNKSLNSVSKDKIKAKINQLKKEWYDFTVKNDVNDITMKINTEKLVDIESILNELLED